MTKSFRKQIIFVFLLILAISAGVLIYNIPYDSQQMDHRNPAYPSSYSDWMDYQITPETILTSLDRGETNVFTPMQATPGLDAQLLPSGSIPWTQADYMSIANATSRYVWKEPLDLKNWSIYYLSFHRECSDNPKGFDSMEITYYKTIKSNWRNTYFTRHIEIYPLASEVSTGSSSDFSSRYFEKDNPIDFTEFRITADDALQIAEENGGKEARLKHENDCLILLRTIHNDNNSWGIDYYFSVYFEMNINPYTGEFRIVDTSK